MTQRLTRRQFVCSSTVLAAAGASAAPMAAAAAPQVGCTLENRYLKYVVGPDARSLHFVDKQTGRDYCGGAGRAPVAHIKKAGKTFDATSAAWADGLLTLAFGDSGVRAVLRPAIHEQYLAIEVVSVSDEQVEEFQFVDVPLTLKGAPEETFAACVLALNLRTNVRELPRPAAQLRAICYPKFGMAGAKVALAAAPPDKLRGVLRAAVTDAPELPHSPIGGPFAMGQPINAGSYLFNFGDMTVEKADDWIKLATELGMNQIDFHGGGSFRFGDLPAQSQNLPGGFQEPQGGRGQAARGRDQGRASHLRVLHQQRLSLGHPGARCPAGQGCHADSGRRPGRRGRRHGPGRRVDGRPCRRLPASSCATA